MEQYHTLARRFQGCGMNKNEMKLSGLDIGFRHLALACLLFVAFEFFCSTAFAQEITFTKKEIAFFQWGNGNNEIANSSQNPQTKVAHYKVYKGTKTPVPVVPEKNTNTISTYLKIDGSDNVYVSDPFHHRVFVIPSGESEIRVIKNASTYGVDEAGDIISALSYKDGLSDFECIKPNGERVVYKNFALGIVENGVIHEANGKQPITILDIGDKPEKLPPSLFSEVENETHAGFDLKTEKVNKHLKKINHKIDGEKIHLSWETKKGFIANGYIQGVDDLGNIYVMVIYYRGWIRPDTETQGFLFIYSPTGEILSKVPLEKNMNVGLSIPIDVHGNFFTSVSSENGVHVFKWEKN